MKQYFNNTSPLQQFLLLVILTLASVLVVSILSLAIGSIIWGSDVLLDLNSMMGNTAVLKFLQVFQSIGLFILPPMLFEMLTSGSVLPSHKDLKKDAVIYAVISVVVVIAAQPFITFLGVLNNGLVLPDYFANVMLWMREKEIAAQKATEIFLISKHWSQYVINVIIIAVLPAIGEEFMFRGALQRIFQSALKNKHWAVFITAALFSAIHIQFFGFLPRFVLGVVFGYLMVYSGNIWLPVLAHFTNNFMAFVIYQWHVVYNSTGINPLEAGIEYPNVFLVVASLLGTVMLIWICRRMYYKRLAEEV